MIDLYRDCDNYVRNEIRCKHLWKTYGVCQVGEKRVFEIPLQAWNLLLWTVIFVSSNVHTKNDLSPALFFNYCLLVRRDIEKALEVAANATIWALRCP